MNKFLLPFLFCSAMVFANPSPPWSKKGHRVIGEVAQHYLKRKTRKALEDLLDGQDLASVSNYADFIKADRQYSEFSAWHYVNIPEGKDYGDQPPSPYGDLVMGIRKCEEIIKDENSSREDRVFYLKMLVHLIGDLHQPMHVSHPDDRGGNDIQLQWFDKGTNLHRVWDANMIDDFGMSYTELTGALPKWSKQQLEAARSGSLLDWVKESQLLADRVYDSVEVGEKLYYRYSFEWWDEVERQLLVGGVRLAKVLNDLFD